MGFEFTFWKFKRFCTGDEAMVTDAQVRYNDLRSDTMTSGLFA